MADDLKAIERLDYKKYVPFVDRDYNLVALLGLTMNAIVKARQRHVEGFGLTATEFHLLIVVAELGDPVTAAEISRILMRKPPTTTALLNRMEKGGLIRRAAHSSNRKLKKVVITEKGEEALRQGRKRDVLNAVVGALSQQEFRHLWLLLEKLKDSALGQAEAANMSAKD